MKVFGFTKPLTSAVVYKYSLTQIKKMSGFVKVKIHDSVDNGDGTISTTVILDPLPEPSKTFHKGMPVVVRYKQLGYWPGIVDTPQEGMVKKPWLTKVKKQVVFLFGLADHTWINEENIFDYQGYTNKKNN